MQAHPPCGRQVRGSGHEILPAVVRVHHQRQLHLPTTGGFVRHNKVFLLLATVTTRLIHKTTTGRGVPTEDGCVPGGAGVRRHAAGRAARAAAAESGAARLPQHPHQTRGAPAPARQLPRPEHHQLQVLPEPARVRRGRHRDH